ncbi:MAG: hypothetical protein IJA07_02760 [Agathobacter sp.]|nr:hypothetical protein [Agathobacter sp.]
MNTNEIERLMRKSSGRIIDLCYEVIDIVKNENFEEQVNQITFFLKNFDIEKDVDTVELTQRITNEEIENLKELYGEYVDSVLETAWKKAYNKSLKEEEFYELLWSGIIKSNILSEIEEISFALYYIIIDVRIPYFPLEQGLKMPEKDFKKVLVSNFEIFKKIRFILSSSFDQKTEEASIILNEIYKLKSEEERVVLLAAIINMFRKQQEEMYEALTHEKENE